MKQKLSDAVCDFVIEEMAKAHGFKNISRLRVQIAYQEIDIYAAATSQYGLFAFARFFLTHPPDPVSLLGDVVRDDV